MADKKITRFEIVPVSVAKKVALREAKLVSVKASPGAKNGRGKSGRGT
jgi:uncharacterized protein YaiL (DUF2058 family)